MHENISKAIWEVVLYHTSDAETLWLLSKGNAPALELMTAFVATPRFITKKAVHPTTEQQNELDRLSPGFRIDGWSLIRLSRVWLLTKLDDSDKASYIKNIETLFDTAEMNELVALYSALPVLAYPEQWLFRATDAVRSNMGFVFDAIAIQNPYPRRYFNELAWNQLILKGIFNDKPIHLIQGLAEKVNEKLAVTLSDFAHERWAAGRRVPPQVWRLIVGFVNNAFLEDLKHLFASSDPADQQAAALVCAETSFPPAHELLHLYPELENGIRSQRISWNHLELTD